MERKLRQRRRNLLIFWIFVLITSWRCSRGRAIPKLIEVEEGTKSTQIMERAEDAVKVRRVLIGSRPPSCERRCSSCTDRCEAVQLPIVPSKPEAEVGISFSYMQNQGP